MTLARVARDAGVSASTVSRYLRNQLRVNPETAARIDAAVTASGYPGPARAARPVGGGRDPVADRIVAMVLPDLDNPFFAALASEMTMQAEVMGFTLVITATGRRAVRESAVSDTLQNISATAGLIYVGMNRTNQRLAEVVARGAPVVIVDEEIDIGHTAVDIVTVDNYGGAYQATSYLIQLGHECIAHVAGPAELSTTQDRLRGFRDAMAAAGLTVDDTLVLHGSHTEQFGASTFPYLTRPGNKPTAVFAGSDIVAIGMLGAAELHGIRIPEDLSIVGCDGVQVGQWLRPQLTTLAQPIKKIASRALEAIAARIDGRPSEATNVVLPLQLVIRGSAGPAPVRRNL